MTPVALIRPCDFLRLFSRSTVDLNEAVKNTKSMCEIKLNQIILPLLGVKFTVARREVVLYNSGEIGPKY